MDEKLKRRRKWLGLAGLALLLIGAGVWWALAPARYHRVMVPGFADGFVSPFNCNTHGFLVLENPERFVFFDWQGREQWRVQTGTEYAGMTSDSMFFNTRMGDATVVPDGNTLGLCLVRNNALVFEEWQTGVKRSSVKLPTRLPLQNEIGIVESNWYTARVYSRAPGEWMVSHSLGSSSFSSTPKEKIGAELFLIRDGKLVARAATPTGLMLDASGQYGIAWSTMGVKYITVATQGPRITVSTRWAKKITLSTDISPTVLTGGRVHYGDAVYDAQGTQKPIASDVETFSHGEVMLSHQGLTVTVGTDTPAPWTCQLPGMSHTANQIDMATDAAGSYLTVSMRLRAPQIIEQLNAPPWLAKFLPGERTVTLVYRRPGRLMGVFTPPTAIYPTPGMTQSTPRMQVGFPVAVSPDGRAVVMQLPRHDPKTHIVHFELYLYCR